MSFTSLLCFPSYDLLLRTRLNAIEILTYLQSLSSSYALRSGVDKFDGRHREGGGRAGGGEREGEGTARGREKRSARRLSVELPPSSRSELFDDKQLLMVEGVVVLTKGRKRGRKGYEGCECWVRGRWTRFRGRQESNFLSFPQLPSTRFSLKLHQHFTKSLSFLVRRLLPPSTLHRVIQLSENLD